MAALTTSYRSCNVTTSAFQVMNLMGCDYGV